MRGITMDAIGTFADAVGKDEFRPYFASMMQQAFAGIELGSARLKECSFLFFGVMSRVFGDEFAQYLPNVVPALISSCKQAEHGEEEHLTSKSPMYYTLFFHVGPDTGFLQSLTLRSLPALRRV